MGLLNTITAPFGVKFEKGGPYPDAGQGDIAAALAKQYADQLGVIIAQIAKGFGVANPLLPLTTTPEGMNTVDVTNENRMPSDMGALTPDDQAAVNQQAGIDRQTYDDILAKVKQRLSADGMGDSATMQAAELYLHQQLSTQLSSEQLAARQQAKQNRMNANQAIAGMLGSGYGAQAQVTAQNQQMALQKTQMANEQLGTILGMAFGPGGFLRGMGKPGEGSVPGGAIDLALPGATKKVGAAAGAPAFGGFDANQAIAAALQHGFGGSTLTPQPLFQTTPYVPTKDMGIYSGV